jgi:hypothetical protein
MSGLFRFAAAALGVALVFSSGVQADAAIISVTDGATIGSLTGTFEFSYDSTLTGTDAEGGYADPNHGLLTFNLDIGGNDFTLAQVYDLGATQPVVLLPGNSNLNADAPGGYSAEGAWYDPSTEIVFALGRLVPVYEASNITAVSYNGTGSNTITYIFYNTSPGLDETPGTLSVTDIEVPEPASIAIFAFGLAGLAAFRRARS